MMKNHVLCCVVVYLAGDGVMYDFILMDYQMPVMAGPAAIAAIRGLGYQGAILGLTGNVLSVDQNVMVAAGADGVLTKPLEIDVLWITLKRLLKR